jgi:hypothetical protein
MLDDKIIRRVRKAREAYSAQFGHDVGAILRDLQERQWTRDRPVVRLAPRPVRSPISVAPPAPAKVAGSD